LAGMPVAASWCRLWCGGAGSVKSVLRHCWGWVVRSVDRSLLSGRLPQGCFQSAGERGTWPARLCADRGVVS
jgi:hypothetical protein